MWCYVLSFVFFNEPATTQFYTSCHTLSLHDALPIFGGGDFGDGAIDRADAMLGGRDRNDRAIVRRPESLAPADIDIVRASVGRLDDQIVAVIRFVGETAPGHAPDQRAAMLRGRIIDRKSTRLNSSH